MYTKVASGIKISVVSKYLEENSNPRRGIYAFSYTIKIENLGDDAIQLLERHWIINSGGGQHQEVVGPGAVGEQPLLEEGASFEYTSGAVIEDPVGSIEGSHVFRSVDGKYFEVPIPQFDLYSPQMLN